MSRQGYTRIPNALISDATLSLAARMVYVYIASQGKDWVFYPEVMERELGIKKRYRLRLLNELTEAGLIERRPVKGHRGISFSYAISVPEKHQNNTISVPERLSKDAISVPEKHSDHLINNKKIVCDKNCARAREAHTQDLKDEDRLMEIFFEATKKAVKELGLPKSKNDVVQGFFEYWTALTDEGVPLWATKQAFNHKSRLKTWLKHERKSI